MSNGEAAAPGGSGSSPFPGCLILTAILVVFGGLALLYTVVGIYQNNAIDGFTQDEAMEIPDLEPSAGQIEDARAKLARIEAAVAENRAERVLFTTDDLNALLGALNVLEDFRGQTRVDRVSSQGIVATMAQPMRKGILGKGVRYLNGVFVFRPELRARTVAFRVLDIRPREGEVPQGFVDNYATLDFFRLDPEREAMKKHIGSLAAVYPEDGHVVVETRVRTEGDAADD